MTEMIALFIVLNLVTAIFAYLGFLISFRGRSDLIAGFNKENYKFPLKYTKLIGFSVFGCATINFVFSFVVVFNYANLKSISGFGWIIVFPPILAALYGNLKYRS